jgi:mono/diheme cytochrome c family protein
VTVLALSTGGAILVGLASGLAVLLVVGAAAAASRRPRRRGGPDIPPGMRPGPSDSDLEKPVLEKLYAWGLVMVVIMALWIPGVFLRENVTNKDDTETLLEQSVERGRETTMKFSEENPLGFDCQRCHGPGLGGGLNVFNGKIIQVPNLQTVCGGPSTGHPLIKSLDDVINTISQGRKGADMPSWSVRFAGAMDDQQINDLVNYILSIQKVPDKDNVCLNPVTS